MDLKIVLTLPQDGFNSTPFSDFYYFLQLRKKKIYNYRNEKIVSMDHLVHMEKHECDLFQCDYAESNRGN